MAIPEQVDRIYVRKRAGQELYLNDRPLEISALIESIEEDFQVSISVDEAKQLFVEYIGEDNGNQLEQEFIGAIRELAVENPKFMKRLEYLSIEELDDIREDKGSAR